MNLRELQEKFNTIKRRMDPETIEREKELKEKGHDKGLCFGECNSRNNRIALVA